MFWWSLLSIQMFAALAEYSTYLQKRFPGGGGTQEKFGKGCQTIKTGWLISLPCKWLTIILIFQTFISNDPSVLF